MPVVCVDCLVGACRHNNMPTTLTSLDERRSTAYTLSTIPLKRQQRLWRAWRSGVLDMQHLSFLPCQRLLARLSQGHSLVYNHVPTTVLSTNGTPLEVTVVPPSGGKHTETASVRTAMHAWLPLENRKPVFYLGGKNMMYCQRGIRKKRFERTPLYERRGTDVVDTYHNAVKLRCSRVQYQTTVSRRASIRGSRILYDNNKCLSSWLHPVARSRWSYPAQSIPLSSVVFGCDIYKASRLFSSPLHPVRRGWISPKLYR